MTPRFVIVGSGRHGSDYIASVLNAAGIRCGHESWWNPFGCQQEGLDGDSSWCAVPFLDDFDGPVFHQVRHPLAVVASLVKAPLWGPYRDLVAPIVKDDLEPLEYAVRVCLELNERCEQHAARRWRVEDVTAATVDAIATAVDLPVHDPEAAVASVPTNTNWHGLGFPVGWGDVPQADRLRDMAYRYGYRR